MHGFLAATRKEALSYMTERVCKELDWFPTPRQCLADIGELHATHQQKGQGAANLLNHTQKRFDEFIGKLHCGEPVELADKPERWLRIAEDRGYLRLLMGNL
jgi:hypothetical protein